MIFNSMRLKEITKGVNIDAEDIWKLSPGSMYLWMPGI